MSKITLHAGDWGKGNASLGFGQLSFSKAGTWKPETIPITKLKSVETASEESVKRIGGAVGWGAVGALALGPVGLLAGMLLGGKGKDVTFVAEFKDGRKILATSDSKTFTKLQAAVF